MSARRVAQIQHIPDFLRTKLVRPRLRSSVIPRDSLLSRLDRCVEYKLTLVCAPAGFGKTTLISTWLANQQDKTRIDPLVAWLSLDDGDNDPIRFWRYVLTASQNFDAAVGQTSLVALQNGQQFVRLEAVLTAFINDLSTLAVSCVLVLDDYHLIASPSIHDTMAFVLEHLPAKAHVILISRSEPALPLARLRANNELLDLRTTDLRFSLEETQRFLQKALPDPMPLQLISQVQSRTDGWAVGLQLVSLALQGQTDEQQREQIVMSFTGSYRPVEEYLVSDVLNSQPEPVQNFLIRSSLLDQLTASLCDAVTGSTHSNRLLERIQKANLFLISLDEAGEWYRFHSLFAEAMQHEAARRLGLDELHALYGRASNWYETHNMLSEAVETALRASAFLRAASLIEGIIETETFARNSELYTLRRWLEQLPESIIYEHPTLCFALARVLLYTRTPRTMPDPTQIDSLLQVAENSWRTQNDPVRLGESLIFRSVFALLRGEHAHIVGDVRQALSSLPQDNVVWRSISLNLIATEELRAGQLDAAHQAAQESLSLWEGTDSNDAIQATVLLLAEIAVGQGELYQAEALCNQVLVDSEKDAIDPAKPLFKAKALVRLASLFYEWNDLDRAERQTRQVIELNKQIGDETPHVEALLILAHILHVRGQAVLAQRTLANLLAQIPLSVSPLFRREIFTCQAQFQFSMGNFSDVQQWLTIKDQYLLRLPTVHREQEDFLRARLLIARGKTDEALHSLNDLREAAQSAGRFRSLIEVQLMMVSAQSAAQNLEAAKQTLGQLLGRAQPAGYCRLILEEGPAIRPLLQLLLVEKRGQPVVAGYIESVLKAFDHVSAENSLSDLVPASGSALLSSQEERILALFVNGLSKKEIADELFISVNTVKTHLQHIYQKLNVSSRAQARALARRIQR